MQYSGDTTYVAQHGRSPPPHPSIAAVAHSWEWLRGQEEAAACRSSLNHWLQRRSCVGGWEPMRLPTVPWMKCPPLQSTPRNTLDPPVFKPQWLCLHYNNGSGHLHLPCHPQCWVWPPTRIKQWMRSMRDYNFHMLIWAQRKQSSVYKAKSWIE